MIYTHRAFIIYTSTMDVVSEYVQNEFTHLGLSVRSVGLHSIMVVLPSDCPDASTLFVELAARGCTVDIATTNSESVLTIWYDAQIFAQLHNPATTVSSPWRWRLLYQSIKWILAIVAIVCFLRWMVLLQSARSQ